MRSENDRALNESYPTRDTNELKSRSQRCRLDFFGLNGLGKLLSGVKPDNFRFIGEYLQFM